jgi:phosphoglycerate kinase
MVGVTKHMSECCGGFLLKKEWEFIGEALTEPKRPYIAVSGGAKVSSKLGILKRLLTKVDGMVIGGAMANTFLLALGHSVGASLAEKDLVDEAKAIMDEADTRGIDILLPVDVVLGKGLDDATALGVVDVNKVPDDAMILDVGPKSVELFAKSLGQASTIMWNGPMGAFENPAFANGSLGVAKAIAGVPDALTVVGGGDTDAVIHKVGLEDKFSFISTGGGSFLEFLEGKELPAFTALKECA